MGRLQQRPSPMGGVVARRMPPSPGTLRFRVVTLSCTCLVRSCAREGTPHGAPTRLYLRRPAKTVRSFNTPHHWSQTDWRSWFGRGLRTANSTLGIARVSGKLVFLMHQPRLRLGQLLVDARILTPEQLEQVLALQKVDGRRLGTLLVEIGLVTETQLTQISVNN